MDVFVRVQAHGWTKHIVSPDQSSDRTLCGMNLQERDCRMTEPDTRHSNWYVFACEKCKRKAERTV